MQQRKNRIRAVIGVVIFHSLVLLILLFSAFTTPLPLPEEEGVEVNLGNSDQGMGDVEPVDNYSPETYRNTNASNDDISSQQTEESVNLHNNNANKNNQTDEFKVNTNALYNKNTNKGGSQGITGNPGNQGNPNGNPNSNNYIGNNPSGNGRPSFKLAGRQSKSLPLPNYNLKEEGVVVVDIWVDKNGKVTKAIAGSRGTTTTSQALWKLAVDAARRSTFYEKSDAAEEQKGTITYNFINLN